MAEQPDVPLPDNDDDTDQNTPTRPLEAITPTSSQPITPPNLPVTGTRRLTPVTGDTPPRAYNAQANRPAAQPSQAMPRATRQDRAAAPLPIPTASYYPPPEAPPMPPASRRGSARARRESGLYLPWWSLLVMLALVGGLAFGALLIVNTLGGQAAPGGATPIVIVITATYTVGPPASQTPIPLPPTLTPPPPLPTIAPSVTLPPGNFVVGANVQVIGVGPSGLNVRSGPGTQYTAKFLGHDSDIFVLKEGPQSASGEEWWHIQDPNNPNNDGWASRRFLTVIAAGSAVGATAVPAGVIK